MKLGTEVGLRPGHIVLGGDPALSLPKKGVKAPNFGPHLLWPNGWMNGWIKRPLGTKLGLGLGNTVLDGGPAPLPKRGALQPPNFRPMYRGQTAGWIQMPKYQSEPPVK